MILFSELRNKLLNISTFKVTNMSKVSCTKCNALILKNTHQKYFGLCAPCYKEKIQHIKYEKFISISGCPSCDGSHDSTFYWKEKTTKFNEYKKYILPIKNLKYGTLYQCRICRIHWYFDPESQIMYVIDKKNLEVLNKWNSKKFLLSEKILTELKKIKENPIGIYGINSKHLIFPCSVLTKKNIRYDKAIIKITYLPPLKWYEDANFVLFCDEIQSILPSPYALPIEVREATSMAQEVRMGFAPTVVQSTGGKIFVLNGETNFFDYQGLIGKDIQLPDGLSKEKEMEYHDSSGNNSTYCFYADYDLCQNIITSERMVRYKEFLNDSGITYHYNKEKLAFPFQKLNILLNRLLEKIKKIFSRT